MRIPANPTTGLRQYLKTEFWIEAAAAAMMAMGVQVFTAPNFIVGGGLSGIASVLFNVFGWPIGVVTFSLNIPLLLIGWRRLGRRFLVSTLRMVAYLSLMIDEVFARIPPYRGEPLLAALFGGVLVGAGLGLILMRGSSTGGTDIIVKLIQMRKPYLSLGRIVLATDLAVVLLAAVVYRNIETILYGAVMIYASTEMIDGLIDRADARKLAIIVTGRGNETARTLMGELRRGVTVLPATGAYTGEARSVLLCVVEIRQLFELKRLVGRIDPAAFVVVANAAETLGAGFKPIEPP